MTASQLRNNLFLFVRKFVLTIFFFAVFPLYCTDSSPIDHAIVSVYAVRRDNNEVLISENCDLSLVPASCMKLVTTAAALQILGSDNKFETQLEYDGFIDDTKTLQGNIYIRGGGDPCLGSGRISGSHSWKEQLGIWGEAIEKLGICKISGRIVADASKWEKALAVPSWTWEDLGNYYGAGASALSFHENSYSISFKPASRQGDQASILHTDPPLASLILHNEVKTGPEGSGDRTCIFGSEFSNVQYVRGTIPSGVDEFFIKGAIPDPSALCADLLTQELQHRGIVVEKKDIGPQINRVGFNITYSPTIQEIVHWTNRKSINLYAEHLLKKIGEEINGEGSTISGAKAVTDFWKSRNVNLNGFNMIDGSGLSRKNLITTRQLVEILLRVEKSNLFPIFFESLPKKKCTMRAKSGSMFLIKGYAGYTDNIAFAVLINQCTNYQAIQEKIDSLFLQINKLDQT